MDERQQTIPQSLDDKFIDGASDRLTYSVIGTLLSDVQRLESQQAQMGFINGTDDTLLDGIDDGLKDCIHDEPKLIQMTKLEKV